MDRSGYFTSSRDAQFILAIAKYLVAYLTNNIALDFINIRKCPKTFRE